MEKDSIRWRNWERERQWSSSAAPHIVATTLSLEWKIPIDVGDGERIVASLSKALVGLAKRQALTPPLLASHPTWKAVHRTLTVMLRRNGEAAAIKQELSVDQSDVDLERVVAHAIRSLVLPRRQFEIDRNWTERGTGGPTFGGTACLHLAHSHEAYCGRCGGVRADLVSDEHRMCHSVCQCDVLRITLPSMSAKMPETTDGASNAECSS